MLDKQKTNASFIGFAGNIGVGKTTFTKLLSKNLQWTPYFESVTDNPYLNDFYNDMERWGFNLQIYFLHKRFQMHQKMSRSSIGVIQDRTIYEDKEIFARNLYQLEKLSSRDWDNYCGLFSVMTSYLKKPDLIIYLRAETDTLLSRIKSRGRDYEKSIDPDYVQTLNLSYDRWIQSITDETVITIQTDDFNIFEDTGKFEEIKTEILERL